MSNPTLTAVTCPDCHGPLTTFGTAAHWCAHCEWNLDQYEPDRHGRPFGWRWVDRRLYRVAYRLTMRQFEALRDSDLAARRMAPARAALTAASVLLLAVIVSLFAGGAFLIGYDFPSLAIVPGVLLILIALVLRPHFGHVDPFLDRISREEAPTLFGLIDQVAAAGNMPRPHVVGVSRTFNASTDAVGLRRRRVLDLGLPLWATLPPQQRVALLAHELGHFANGDIRRGLLTQIAFNTMGRLAYVTSPDPYDLHRARGLHAIAVYFSHLIMWVISRLLWAAHLVLVWVGLRDAQRAEYLADRWTVTIAGSAGARGLTDTLVTLDSLAPMVARAARAKGDATAWRAAAEATRTAVEPELPMRQQLSIRDEASLFSSHPPTGLRRRMLDAQPWRDPTVVLTETQSVQIDVELAKRYARARNDVGALT